MNPGNKLKMESSKKAPGFISVQVLGSGTRGAPAVVYVFTDQSRYLFNCGEGTQRLANEHKFKLGKLEHVFITSKRWSMIGGLPGLGLNVQDAGVLRINLHGPPALEEIFTRTSNFIILERLHVHVHSWLSNHFFEDHCLRVDYVPLYSSTSSYCDKCAGIPNDNDEWYNFKEIADQSDNLIDYHPVLDGSPKQVNVTVEPADENIANEEESKNPSGAEVAVCFICTPKRKAPTLLMDRCKELGVPPGPLLMQLKSGQNVTLPNGTVVLAAHVTTEENPDPTFIIIDCPAEEFLGSLVNNPVWKKFQSSAGVTGESEVGVVVHFTRENILSNPVYVQWMEKFDKKVQHVLVNDSCTTSGNESAHRLQETLNNLDGNIFPFLHEGKQRIRQSESFQKSKSENDAGDITSAPGSAVLGKPLLTYRIRPHHGIESVSQGNHKSRDNQIEIEDANANATAEELRKLKQAFQGLEASACKQEFPKVLFLGTGSCIPNKTRNVSAILIEISDQSKMFLDCGEGTFGQLLRFYGSDKIDEILTQIKIIYVSHLHADHHLGLISLLQERQSAFKKLSLTLKPVLLLAPAQIHFWLRFYDNSFEKIRHTFVLIPNNVLSASDSTLESDSDVLQMVKFKEVLCEMRLKGIETVLVDHCPDAFGVAIIHQSGWKIVYSGDTRPCDNLIALGMNCDLCIHEATMEDELMEEAKYKMHCTVSEAVEMGNQMKAKFTLLTHFSQRYAKLPKISSELGDHVGLAYDNMLIRLGDLPKLPRMYPVLKLLFAEEHAAMEMKTIKKLCQS